MEWVPAIISIMGAVVVWVNAALTAFTGGGILDWGLPAWWGMPAEGLAYAKPIEGTCYIAIIQNGNARSGSATSTENVAFSQELVASADLDIDPSRYTSGTRDYAILSVVSSNGSELR